MVKVPLNRFIRGACLTERRSGIGHDPHMAIADRKSTRLNSSHTVISYAVFCLKKKNPTQSRHPSLTPQEGRCSRFHSSFPCERGRAQPWSGHRHAEPRAIRKQLSTDERCTPQK